MKRTKKFLIGLLACLGVFAGSIGLAACGEMGGSQGLEYTLLEDGTYEVAWIGDCTDTKIVIPRRYNRKTVTSIGDEAFEDCKNLTSIEIPDSVTYIGFNAFASCDSLTGVYISSVEAWCNISFGEDPTNPLSFGLSNPLYYAKNLYLNNELVTELEIPKTVTEIKEGAFFSCDGLTSVVIGEGVTCIGNRAFLFCDNLTSITIPDSVTYIGFNAFTGCSSSTYNVKDNLAYLGNEQNPYLYLEYVVDKSITSATIDSACKLIGNAAFRNCDSLTNIEIPDSVSSIGESAFDYCDNLASVTIGGSVTSIGDFAFSQCRSLTSIEIPDNVTSIGNHAFFYCDSLTNIEIPDSVMSIGGQAFAYCDSLTSITFNGTVEEWNAIEKGREWNDDVPATKVVCSDGEVAL